MDGPNAPQLNRTPPNGSYVIALMAFLTLGMAVVLPIISGQFSNNGASASESRIVSPQRQAFEIQRGAMTLVEGGVFFQGTSLDEISTALADCPTCDVAQAESAAPAHRVEIAPFWMENSEVSYAQYVAFLNTLGAGAHVTGCGGQPCIITTTENSTSGIALAGGKYSTTNPAYNDYPVANVTWYGANAYCNALGRRLPTEAEWEYAASGPQDTRYPWGDEWTFDAANVRGAFTNDNGVVMAQARPAGGYGDYASRDAVRDLAGNVAEWTADWYAADWYLQIAAGQAPPGTGPLDGTTKVVRGGSWNDTPFFARAVNRAYLAPDAASPYIGFRCVTDA